MKKYLAIVAAAVMVAALALVGCSSGGSSSSSAASSSSSSSSSASSTASSSSETSDEMTLLEEGKLIVATAPDFPPFENLVDGEHVGLDIAIAEAVAEKLDLELEFKDFGEFEAIIPAIAGGGQADMGISGFSVDPDRAKEIDFTDSYYIDDQAVAVMKGGDITADNADEALDAEGITIAVQSGTTGETYVKENYPNAQVQPYGNSTDAFAAMQSGQADAVCTNLAVVESMLATAYQDAEIVKTVATGEEYAIVVSQDNPALTEAINDALAELKADGTIDKLIEQYM